MNIWLRPLALFTTTLAVFGAAFGSAGAFACDGSSISSSPAPNGHITDLQLSILMASMVAAPILAALLVDRGAYTLAAYANGMKRRHLPSAVGPLLAVAAVVVALGAVTARDFNLAIVGFAVVPVAAAACAVSFARSVIVDMAGHRAAQAVRTGAVAVFIALSIARLYL